MAAKYPGRVEFSQEEIEQIVWARLVLLGVPPSEIESLDDEEIEVILQVAAGEEAARAGKIYGLVDV